MTQCAWKEKERAEILLAAASGVERLSEKAASHLLTCDSCSEAFAAQTMLWNRLDLWKVPEVSSSFNRELYAKIDAALAEPWYDRWASQIKAAFAQPSFALALAALIVIAGFTVNHSAVKPTPAMQVSTSEAEQVEKTLDDLDMLRQFDLPVEEKETTSKSM